MRWVDSYCGFMESSIYRDEWLAGYQTFCHTLHICPQSINYFEAQDQVEAVYARDIHYDSFLNDLFRCYPSFQQVPFHSAHEPHKSSISWFTQCLACQTFFHSCDPLIYNHHHGLPCVCTHRPGGCSCPKSQEIIVKLFTAHCITEAPRLIILDSQGTIVQENARGGASVLRPFDVESGDGRI